MQAKFTAENFLDKDGNPAGGYAKGVGIDIKFQDGPLGRDGDRQEPNGAFVETLAAIILQRIEHYQGGKFKCRENALAFTKFEEGLMWLNKRTQGREERKVEGTHQV